MQSKSISKPITRVIDKGKFGEIDQESKILTYFDKTKQSFAGLFSLLSLKKTADTLIKINSIKRVPKQITEETINSDNPTKPSMSKINIRDPFQKLPKQASLLNFTQNIDKKPGQNSSSLQTTVQNSAISNENVDSLDIDYEKVFKLDYTAYENLSMYKPPETFRSQLHPYQSKALTWMLKREGVLKEEDKEIKPLKMRTLHPLWEEYKLNDESCLFFNPYSGQVSLEFPHSTNSELKGGILADEMGLGKTVMMISLLHSNPDPRKHEKKELMGLFQEKKMKIRGAGTLVIVPLTLLSQWEEEILTHSIPNYFRHVLYYGDVRPTNLENFDIVFTTYGVVSSEYANQKGELFNYTWFRIVLDEAHYIKGRTIQIAKAVYNLKGDSRWCMTGTPVQNKLDDLFSLIHFLRVEPWSDYLWWNSYINKPYEKKDNMVFDVIQTIIAPILLRRTKSTKDKNGQSIIDLPEKETIIEWVEFSKEEANLYKEVYQKSKKEFDDLLSKGTFLSNYMHVFDILTRLRQICDHPYLILTRSDYVNKEKLEETLKKFVERRLTEKNSSKTLQNTENDIPANHNQLPANHFEILYDEASNQEIIINLDKKKEHKFNEKYFEEVISKIKNNEIENCVVCLGEIEDAVITLCLHVTCRLCLIRSLESNGMCPFCRKLLTREDFMTVPRDSKFDIDLDSKFRRSSKLEKMMKNVARVMQLNEKIVIFSQFIGMLDLIEYDFKRNNIVYLRLDGSLSQKKRAEILTKFKEDPNIFIIMISLKAGGVGLNLVEANHVFLMDPWWNPAVEEQAVERVHRIGQKKKVEVIRFICKDSIEERMIELHKAKKELFNQTINMENGDRTMDKKKQNIEYFKYLMTNY